MNGASTDAEQRGRCCFGSSDSKMVTAMPAARAVAADDLERLLDLFRELHAASKVSRHAEPREKAEAIWARTLARDGLKVFVSEAGSRFVATCMLFTAPNLLRGGRQHGIIENVATHPDYEGKGHGRAVIAAALEEAWRQDCHHVMLQSGRVDPRVHTFYESCGFKPNLRTAYAVSRPTHL
jgi:GNAT superfamily N-acetyltransferase